MKALSRFFTIVILAVVILLLVYQFVLPQLFPQPQNEFTCVPIADKVEGYEGYERYMKTEWLISDNVTSYNDIPKSERRNLSEDAKEFLKGNPSQRREFTPIDYQELSSREKEIFKRAIKERIKGNYSEVSEYAEIIRSDGKNNHILYRNVLYDCDIIRPEEGA